LADFIELDIESGANFAMQIEVTNSDETPRSLSNHTITSQLRKSYYSSTATDFIISITDSANGIVAMTLTANTTANLRAGRYVFDVEMNDTSNNSIQRIFEGIATVLPNVTR